jgi:hypothetical protein
MYRHILLIAFLALLGGAPVLHSSTTSPWTGQEHGAVLSPARPTTADPLVLDATMVVADSCFFLRDYRVRVDESKRRVIVDFRVAMQKNVGCLQVALAIEQRVLIAPLLEGEWEIDVRYRYRGKLVHEQEFLIDVLAE